MNLDFAVTMNERLARDFDALAAHYGVTRAEIFKRAIAAYAFASTDATTQSEIVCRALALYALARAEAQDGGQVILKSGSGAERQVVAF